MQKHKGLWIGVCKMRTPIHSYLDAGASIFPDLPNSV